MIALRKYCDSAAPIKRDPSSPRRQPQKTTSAEQPFPHRRLPTYTAGYSSYPRLYQVLLKFVIIIRPFFCYVKYFFKKNCFL